MKCGNVQEDWAWRDKAEPQRGEEEGRGHVTQIPVWLILAFLLARDDGTVSHSQTDVSWCRNLADRLCRLHIILYRSHSRITMFASTSAEINVLRSLKLVIPFDTC